MNLPHPDELPNIVFWFENFCPADDWRAWYVYGLFPMDDKTTCIYIGWCEARELLTGSNMRSNTAAQKYLREKPDAKFIFSCIGKCATKDEAMRIGGKWVYKLRPHWNMSGYNSSRARRVRCMNNGMEFNSVTEAAQWIGCAAASMSSHLSRRPGYGTIKDHEFERMM